MSEPVRQAARERATAELREAEAAAANAEPQVAVTSAIVEETPAAALRAESRRCSPRSWRVPPDTCSSLLAKLGLERRTQAAVLATRLLGGHRADQPPRIRVTVSDR
jgi:hypothetical protein